MKKDKKKFNEIISFIKNSQNVLNTVTANINMLVRPSLTSIFKTNKLYKNPYNFSNKVTPLLNIINKSVSADKNNIPSANNYPPYSSAKKASPNKNPHLRVDSDNISAYFSVNSVLNKIFNNASNTLHTSSQNFPEKKYESFVSYLPYVQTILNQIPSVSPTSLPLRKISAAPSVFSPIRRFSPASEPPAPLRATSLSRSVSSPLKKIFPAFHSSANTAKKSRSFPVYPQSLKYFPISYNTEKNSPSLSAFSPLHQTFPNPAPVSKNPSPPFGTASALNKIVSNLISVPFSPANHMQIKHTMPALGSPISANTYLGKSWNKLREAISLTSNGDSSNINVSPNISVEVKQSPHSNNFNDIWTEIGRRLKNELASSTDGLY